ncbi:hypothetical protein CRG98_022329 [Punica granatum]|uniref:Uncharacterized protein n=1 Tax=Punica granatum TaxID=22663 RepID=A0A2I0JN20_PUNGR|nr:hypothetical protein CRG98_022329 [Punica granatum]
MPFPGRDVLLDYNPRCSGAKDARSGELSVRGGRARARQGLRRVVTGARAGKKTSGAHGHAHGRTVTSAGLHRRRTSEQACACVQAHDYAERLGTRAGDGFTVHLRA